MTRTGVVIVSGDDAVRRFFRDAVESHAPGQAPVAEFTSGKECIASLAGSQRRRFVVIDAVLPDVSVSNLLEAIRLVDPTIPVILVLDRSRGHGGALPDGVHVVEKNSFASTSTECLVVDLLQRLNC